MTLPNLSRSWAISAAGNEQMRIPKGYHYVTVFNTSGYNVAVYKGQSQSLQDRVAFTAIYALVTFPLPDDTELVTITWSGGTSADQFQIVFSVVSLNVNASMIAPSGSASTTIVGDSVGLARQAQLPAALTGSGNLAVAIKEPIAQLPSALTAGGNLKVALVEDTETTLAKGAQLPSALTAGGNLKVALVEDTETTLAKGAQLPSALTAAGNFKEALQEDNVGLLRYASSPTLYAVPCTVANTEYSQALPANTKKLLVKARSTTNNDFRLAYVTGKVAGPTDPYMTVGAGTQYFEDGLLTSQTVFVGSATAGTVVEILAWT